MRINQMGLRKLKLKIEMENVAKKRIEAFKPLRNRSCIRDLLTLIASVSNITVLYMVNM